MMLHAKPEPSTCSPHADAFLSPTHHLRSCHRPSVSKASARPATTHPWAHQLSSTSLPIHASQNTATVPEPDSISIDPRQITASALNACAFLQVSLSKPPRIIVEPSPGLILEAVPIKASDYLSMWGALILFLECVRLINGSARMTAETTLSGSRFVETHPLRYFVRSR
jgi:hypothetical protein